jgi:DNA-binding response OmpR family regulator
MKKRILYVDDNAIMLELIQTLLEGAGYQALTARDPDQALRLAKENSLGAVILDVNLAGDSGLMLMDFMRHDHAGVPIILYSGGDHQQAAVEKMIALGAAQFVTKRTGQEIVAAVKKVCPPV